MKLQFLCLLPVSLYTHVLLGLGLDTNNHATLMDAWKAAGPEARQATLLSTSVQVLDGMLAVSFSPVAADRLYVMEHSAGLADGGSWQIVRAEAGKSMGAEGALAGAFAIEPSAFYRVLVTEIGSATVYFVSSSTGDDTNDGLSPSTAWKTLSRVRSQDLLPGDSVLLKAGDEWRERLVVLHSGESGDPVRYGSFGSGPKPRVLASTKLETWENVDGNTWKSAETLSNPWIAYNASGTNAQVFFVENDGSITWGYHRDTVAGLVTDYDWAWESGYLYIRSTRDPNTAFRGIEAPQREDCVSLGNVNHIVIDSLEMAYAGGMGIRGTWPPRDLTGLRITNCHIHHIGRKGSNVAYGTYTYHSDTYIGNCEINDCGRRGIALSAVASSIGANITGVVVEHNHLHHGFHTTGVDMIIDSPNTITGVVIRHNLFEGHPEVFLRGGDRQDILYDDGLNTNHIYVSGRSGTTGGITGLDIYRNVFTYSSGKAVALDSVQSARVCNNTFYAVNPSLANSQGFVWISEGVGGPRDIVVKNNIFYNDMDNSFNSYFFSQKVDADHVTDLDADYNLYFSTDPANALFHITQATDASGAVLPSRSYRMADWFALQSLEGWELHSPAPANPLFMDGSGGRLQLTSLSPAVDAGVDIPGITDGYLGNGPDLGAFESAFHSSLPADAEPPTQPSDLSATAVLGRSVSLSWSPSFDNAGLAGYRVYRDGALVGVSPATAFEDHTVQPEGTYAYSVSAVDRSNNASLPSLSVQVTTPPVVTLDVVVTASTVDGSNVPENTLDNDLATRWSGLGVGAWIQYVFGEVQTVNNLSIAFYNGNLRKTWFTVEASADGITWTTVGDFASSGTTVEREDFPFDTVTSRYFRIVGGGNSSNEWNSYTEVAWQFIP